MLVMKVCSPSWDRIGESDGSPSMHPGKTLFRDLLLNIPTDLFSAMENCPLEARLRLVKSTQILHLPLCFLTTTGLKIQSGNPASLIGLTFSSLCTSSSTALAFSGEAQRGLCLIGLVVGSIWSLWHMTLELMPGMS